MRPASPSARAGTMMAAIKTKFKVALERSRFPESDWTVVGITAAYLLTAPLQQLANTPAPPPPNEAGGCWKELPETLAKKKAIGTLERGPPLLHVVRLRPLPRGRRARQAPAVKGRTPNCRPPRTPPGLAALARGGLLRPGLPTDRPVGFDDIEAFKLRNAGRVRSLSRVAANRGRMEYYHVLQQRAPAAPEHRAASSAQRPLQPLACYADLEVYSTPAPTVHIASSRRARPLRLLPAMSPLGAALRATQEAEAQAYAPQARQQQVPRRPLHA